MRVFRATCDNLHLFEDAEASILVQSLSTGDALILLDEDGIGGGRGSALLTGWPVLATRGPAFVVMHEGWSFPGRIFEELE